MDIPTVTNSAPLAAYFFFIMKEIPMGTYSAPLVADLVLFCCERDCVFRIVIEAFNWTSRYLNNYLNIDNSSFEGIVTQIYPTDLQVEQS